MIDWLTDSNNVFHSGFSLNKLKDKCIYAQINWAYIIKKIF
jgi:hypothetical protein